MSCMDTDAVFVCSSNGHVAIFWREEINPAKLDHVLQVATTVDKSDNGFALHAYTGSQLGQTVSRLFTDIPNATLS